MYMPHKKELLPDDMEAPIWRYMSFTKFVDMLHRQSLFFSRPDCLKGDNFEGTVGRASFNALEDELNKMGEDGGGVVGGVDFQLKSLRKNSSFLRCITAVNCWHQNQHESEAMWRLYVHSDQGIAIKSRTSKLIKSFTEDKGLLIHVGVVKYIDYDNEAIPSDNLMTPLVHKRKSFEHEKELRAIACKAAITETRDGGISIKTLTEEFAKPGENVAVNLTMLIESIHLAPGSPSYMTELVASVVDRYGFDVPVFQSKLDDEPY